MKYAELKSKVESMQAESTRRGRRHCRWRVVTVKLTAKSALMGVSILVAAG
jgi:hypothetical protein